MPPRSIELASSAPRRGYCARPHRRFILLLDIAIDDAAGRELVEALAERATAIVATVPHGDRDTIAHFSAMRAAIEERPGRGTTDLALLRRFLFITSEEPPRRTLDGSLEFFSAPGEGRECVEIARRILEHARAGVAFDEMAILVRTPQNYFGLLEPALKRAGIEAWFDRGTRRPHPAGRAFLALLACAAEHLSAARFREYLSLSQVPDEASLTAGPLRMTTPLSGTHVTTAAMGGTAGRSPSVCPLNLRRTTTMTTTMTVVRRGPRSGIRNPRSRMS